MTAGLAISTTRRLHPTQAVELRALLDGAFGDGFDRHDFEHALGGEHVFAHLDRALVGHASVVPRFVWIDGDRVEVGYVEAVAVDPDHQARGLGTLVMQAVAEIITDRYRLGLLSTGKWHFYERLGWRRWTGPTGVRLGDGYMAPTPDDDDSIMFFATGARADSTADIDPSLPIACEPRPGDSW